MTDDQPRYTTKRLHDEIAKARAYGMELAASMCIERAAEYDASFDSTTYKTETLAGSAALTAIAARIRENAADPTPEPQTTDLQNDPATLRSYCQQLLDLIENYGVEVEGEDNDLVAHISRSVDPAHIEAEGRNDG